MLGSNGNKMDIEFIPLEGGRNEAAGWWKGGRVVEGWWQGGRVEARWKQGGRVAGWKQGGRVVVKLRLCDGVEGDVVQGTLKGSEGGKEGKGRKGRRGEV